MLGETISHYRILEKLGQGGMGEVYLAEDTRLERKVALKFLAPELARDHESLVRFRNEAKAAAELSHPNIAAIYDIGENDGKPFLVLEYVQGQTLRERIALGQLPIQDVLRIGQALAAGLAEAHSQGIVHRDIKSANIMLTEKGEVKILDFGLAHRHDATRVTRMGTTLGTVAYMSPEQARGEDADERSDIWSLGVVLYESLTQKLPFAGERDVAILHQILNADHVPASRHRAGLPPELEVVLGIALAKKRENRYATAGELANDLIQLQAGRTLAPVSLPRRSWMRWAVGVIAGGGLAIAVYSAISNFEASKKSPEHETISMVRSAVAVLPFTVRGDRDAAGLSEGMVDLLSSKLDGAGSLRSIDPRALLTYVRQADVTTGDLVQVRETAKHFGAGLCIVGDVFQSADQVHINAALYESNGALDPVATASIQGDTSSILALVDELAAKLLQEQFGSDGETPFDLGSTTTRSYPALKAYLAGESARRAAGHSDWEKLKEAEGAYERAVELDSTFALAWYRLAEIAERNPLVEVDAHAAIEQALTHAAGLSEHDQLHLRGLKAQIDDDIDQAEQIYQTLLGIAPECLDATVGLSRLRHYDGWRRGRPISDETGLLDRALALDPENRELMFRRYWVDVFTRDWSEAEELLHRMYGKDNIPTSAKATLAYARNDKELEREVIEELISIPDRDKVNSILHVAVFADDMDGARQLARLLTVGEHADEAKTLGHLILAHIEAACGRWVATTEELASVAALRPELAIEYKALLAAHPFLRVSPQEREAILDEVRTWDASDVPPSVSQLPWIHSHDGFHPVFKTYLTGLLENSLGHYSSAAQLAMELEHMSCGPPDTTLAFDLAQALRGFAAMQEGRDEEALEEFSKAYLQVSFSKQIGSLIHFRSLERYLRAELLYQMGKYEEAMSWFDSLAWSVSYEYIYEAPAHLRRAQICERLGRTAQAAEHYLRFVQFWKDCDAALRPMVDEAEGRLRDLSTTRKLGLPD